jgi:hypothetical protein
MGCDRHSVHVFSAAEFRRISAFSGMLIALRWRRFLLSIVKGGFMQTVMEKSQIIGFDHADEVRSFPNGKLELININGGTVGRATLEPGWQWSKSVKPIAKTEFCEAPHFQYQVSGTLKIHMEDGTEFTSRAGDLSLLASGHDAWVVGSEPVVLVDFQGMSNYAKSPV